MSEFSNMPLDEGLKGAIKRIEAENAHLKEHATYLARQANELARERDALKSHVRTLREALKGLLNEQSGAPQRWAQWHSAVDTARTALAATEDAK